MAGSFIDIPMMDSEDLSNLPRSEIVYRQIKTAIVEARIGLGERLYESVVAKKFNASRTPVREALQRLGSEGLLVRSGRAYLVPDISVSLVDQLYTAREALECKAVELLLISDRKVDLSYAKTKLIEMNAAVEARDYISFGYADMDFHKEIATQAGNKFLIEMLETVCDKVLMVRNQMFRQPERLTDSLIEHQMILNSIERGVTMLAVEEMRAHLRSVAVILSQTKAAASDDKKTKLNE